MSLASDLARELKAGDRVLLEGPLGAGKTTFAKALLRGLGVRQPAEGSPTFAIAHEYGEVIHIDFYRLKSEAEIDDAGIPAYFWERKAVVIAEWVSMFPEFAAKVRESGRVWDVKLSFSDDPARRNVEISKS